MNPTHWRYHEIRMGFDSDGILSTRTIDSNDVWNGEYGVYGFTWTGKLLLEQSIDNYFLVGAI